jgi:hypothetical protein
MSGISLKRAGLAGAALAGAVVMAGMALAQTAPAKVPDFSGFFSQNTSVYLPPARGGVGPVMDHPNYPHQQNSPITGQLVREWVGDYSNPMLKPHVAAEVKRMGDVELAGGFNLAAYQLCWPTGVPLILTMRENIQLLQQPDKVTIIYQRDHVVRHIYLNVPHPKNPRPSWYGSSVGHYEGDTLVVDTIAMNGKARADRYGSFSTEQLHVTERYHLADNGQALQVDFTVEDPGTFNTAWNGTQKYRRTRGPFEEVVCAENNRDAEADGKGEYSNMPVAAKPDF